MTNARQLKARLMARLKELDEEKASVVAELAKVDKFLSATDAYATVDPRKAKAPPIELNSDSARRRPSNPPREQVLEVVAEALERAGRPMQLRELFQAVTDAGINLQGAEPSAVLGTMVWRDRKRFANLKGFGYWFADRDYEPASYKPE